MKDKLYGLQFLRGLASMLVLIEHVLKETESRFGANLDYIHFPWPVGIDLFFVISGFIIFYISDQKFGEPGVRRDFIYRRVTRVVPIYYLFTTLVVALLLISPTVFGKTTLDWAQVIHSYLFIPYERYDGRVAPVLSLGWTLNYEMFFYVLFFIFVGFTRRVALLGLSALLLSLVIAGRILPIDSAAFSFWTSTLLLEFLAGIWIAVLAQRFSVAKTNWPVFIALNIIALGWLWWSFQIESLAALPGAIVQGSACALLVFTYTIVLARPDGARIPRLFVLLGDSSYALYLSHRFPLRAGTLVWQKLFGSGYPGLFVPFLIAVCTAAGIAVYFLVERPMLRLTAKWQPRPIMPPPHRAIRQAGT